MRARSLVFLLAAMLTVSAILTMSPAPAASGYEMGGGGTLTASSTSPGMPACAPVANQPAANCGTSTANTFLFGSLPIGSAGVLFDQPQAASYDCQASNVTTVGGTDNFRLNWNFDCTLTNGVGHARITGNFQNSANPGVPLFAGCFKVGSSTAQQYNCSGTSGRTIVATCAGMFEPTSFTGSPPRITQVLFEGECTSAG
ncbi:MAG: hypothetical protein ACRDJM_07225 [Actinomycetota bacterium]